MSAFEQKSSSVNLNDEEIFRQDKRYNDAFEYSRKARWIITCNFREFRVFNMDKRYPEREQIKISLFEMPKKFATLKFLDPACGSGNFLTETYISLRRLENDILKELLENKIILGELEDPIKISIQNFYGIEINNFAVTVAQTALWIAELKMKCETKEIVHKSLPSAATKKSYVDYLLTDWINEKRDVEQLEESTIQTHISRINYYFPDFFGDTELQKIDSKLIAGFYAQLSTKNFFVETLHKIHAIINNSFKKSCS